MQPRGKGVFGPFVLGKVKKQISAPTDIRRLHTACFHWNCDLFRLADAPFVVERKAVGALEKGMPMG